MYAHLRDLIEDEKLIADIIRSRNISGLKAQNFKSDYRQRLVTINIGGSPYHSDLCSESNNNIIPVGSLQSSKDFSFFVGEFKSVDLEITSVVTPGSINLNAALARRNSAGANVYTTAWRKWYDTPAVAPIKSVDPGNPGIIVASHLETYTNVATDVSGYMTVAIAGWVFYPR